MTSSLRERRELQKSRGEDNDDMTGGSPPVGASNVVDHHGPSFKDQVQEGTPPSSSTAAATRVGASNVVPSSSSETTRAGAFNVTSSLRERRELQKSRGDDNDDTTGGSPPVGASNVVDQHGPSFKDQVREGTPPSSGPAAATRVGASNVVPSSSSGTASKDGPSFKDQVREGSPPSSGTAAATRAVVASSSRSATSDGPSSKDQVPGARSSSSLMMNPRQKYDMMRTSTRHTEEEKVEMMDSVFDVGAALEVAGVAGSSSAEQERYPTFKDQVQDGTPSSDPVEDVLNPPGARPVRGPEADDDQKSEDGDANFLIEAKLVEEAPSAIHVAVELEKEPPRKPWKSVVVGVAFILVAIGAVVGIVLSQQNGSDKDAVVNTSESSPAAPPILFTECENATALELGGEIVDVTVGGNSTILSVPQSCGADFVVPEAVGVWFDFATEGTTSTAGVSISTCTDDPSKNGDFDSMILVFTGSCERPICVVGNDNLQQVDCITESGVSFRASPSTVYHVLVYGRRVSNETVDFAVQAKSARVTPSNNICDTPQLLNNRIPVNATLLDTDPPSSDVPECEGFESPLDYESPGVWFLYETDDSQIEEGDEVIITTCSPAESFGLDINVFSGTCDVLDCDSVQLLREADEGEGSLACDGGVLNSVRFRPQPQSAYRILVQSNDSTVLGDFSIQARNSIFELAENDECETAMPLTAGLVAEGSTVFATAGENAPPVCGTAVSSNSPDLWYSIESTSSDTSVLKATSCTGNTDLDANSFDNQLVVYSGDCNNLVCIQGDNGVFYEEDVCHLKGTVNWQAQEGVMYYIRVLGTDTSAGEFGIKVEETAPLPSNDICEDAASLQPGVAATSITIGASVDVDLGTRSCNILNHADSVGVWFQVLGDDEQYTVSTCSGDENLDFIGIDFDSQIQVYSGSSCGNLTCVGVNEDNNQDRDCNAGVSWFARSGETYWIRVYGNNNSTGSFPIVVSPTPENDMCESAETLLLNQTLKGTTLAGRVGPELSVCGGAYQFSADNLPAAWYSVVGTGDVLTVSTCTGNSTLDENGYDSQIVVYFGDCSSLLCVAGNDNDGRDECFGYNSGASWSSIAGEVYYVKVFGGFLDGSFGITLYEGEPTGGTLPPGSQLPTGPPVPAPPNDLCENAILLISGSAAAAGTTAGATAGFDATVCGDILPGRNEPDVWYRFDGTGSVHTATTCTGTALDFTDYYSQLLVYSGECGNLTCIAGNENNFLLTCSGGTHAGASWLTEEGVSYYIRIMPLSVFDAGAFGDEFGLIIEDGDTLSRPPPENDQCQNATMLVLDQIEQGTTRGGATLTLDLSVCGDAVEPPDSNPDLWYSFVGTGTSVTVSTCTGTSLDDTLTFDTQLAVYGGDCETGLLCLDGNDEDDREFCFGKSGVAWQADLGVTYWIRVFGYSDAGDFAITVYDGDPIVSPTP